MPASGSNFEIQGQARPFGKFPFLPLGLRHWSDVEGLQWRRNTKAHQTRQASRPLVLLPVLKVNSVKIHIQILQALL